MINSVIVKRLGSKAVGSHIFINAKCLSTKSVIQDIKFDNFQVNNNQPVYGYLKGSKERRVLESSLQQYLKGTVEIPIIIGNKEYKTDYVQYQSMPHEHGHKIAKFYHATPELIQKRINSAVATQTDWKQLPSQKADIWLRVGNLMALPQIQRLNAKTMLGQSETVIQAEIDAAAELFENFYINNRPTSSVVGQQPFPGVRMPRPLEPLIQDILQDPLPVLNSIIEAPTPNQEKKQAARLVVIRRIKMNRHKLKKLRKRMKYIWAKVRLRRETWREKTFLTEKMAQVKAAWKFDAKTYVAQLIRNVRDKKVPEPWIRPGMPDSIIKEQIKIREEKKRKEFLGILDKRLT